MKQYSYLEVYLKAKAYLSSLLSMLTFSISRQQPGIRDTALNNGANHCNLPWPVSGPRLGASRMPRAQNWRRHWLAGSCKSQTHQQLRTGSSSKSAPRASHLPRLPLVQPRSVSSSQNERHGFGRPPNARLALKVLWFYKFKFPKKDLRGHVKKLILQKKVTFLKCINRYFNKSFCFFLVVCVCLQPRANAELTYFPWYMAFLENFQECLLIKKEKSLNES